MRIRQNHIRRCLEIGVEIKERTLYGVVEMWREVVGAVDEGD